LRDQIVQIMIGLENHIAAAPAVAATGATFGGILFALEGHATFAAVAGPRIDFDLVNKHALKPGLNKNGEAAGLAARL
jgi:hypothetical protein